MPRAVVFVLLVLLGGCGGANGGGTDGGDSPAVVECLTAYRESASRPALEEETLRLDAHGAKERARFHDLEAHAELSDWPTEGWGLILFVTRPGEEERLAQQTYALRPGERPPNTFGALPDGHGFTGLHYHYAASGAELQYFCGAP